MPDDYLSFAAKFSLADFAEERISIRGIINRPYNLPADDVEFKQDSLSYYKKPYKVEDFFFIGDDENACYFAYSIKNKKLYVFDDEMDFKVTKYKSLTAYINYRLNHMNYEEE